MRGRLAPWFGSRTVGDREPRSYRAWKALWQRLPTGRGSTLFDRIRANEWDLLVILDACRFDTLASLADCCVVERERSPASSTPEFLAAAAETGLFSEATYLSANPQVNDHPPGGGRLADISGSDWDPDLETVPPDAVYEAALPMVREGEQVVAHTLQPHYPHITELDGEVRPVPGGVHPANHDVLAEQSSLQAVLAQGGIDLEEARQSHRIATRYAWDRARETALELAREGYTVAVTADHGELFGEWGFVEHPVGVRLPGVVDVPWVQIGPTAFDQETAADADDSGVTDRLEALGYVE